MEDLEEAAVMAGEWALDFEDLRPDGPMWGSDVEVFLGAMRTADMGIPQWRTGRVDFLPQWTHELGPWDLTAPQTLPSRSCNF
jgi:hypothetical protein